MSSTTTNSNSKNVLLFACTRCNGRYRFEDLSGSQQLCRECRGSTRTVKCTYCRAEFLQENRESSSSRLQTICKKCEKLKDKHGPPSACVYCNIIAAFIGNKCQRCAISEEKYGAPQDCEMCKQRCAFDRKDPDHKKILDGKLLCWLCTISTKRALAKQKQNTASIRHTSMGSPKSSKDYKSHSRESSSTLLSSPSRDSKRPRHESKSNGAQIKMEPSSSQSDILGIRTNSNDQFNVLAISQLKEQIASLQRLLQKKDQELIEKDKKIAELNANFRREEREWREKLNSEQKKMTEKMESYQQKMSQLQKQNATLSKQVRKPSSRAPDSPADSPLL